MAGIQTEDFAPTYVTYYVLVGVYNDNNFWFHPIVVQRPHRTEKSTEQPFVGTVR